MTNRSLPHNIPKRGLNRLETAEYVGLSPNSFDAAVSGGLFPAPLCIGRRKVWDRRAMDLTLDRLAGIVHVEQEMHDLDEELGLGARSTA